MLTRERYPDARTFHYPATLEATGCLVLPRSRVFDESEYRDLVFDNDLPTMTWATSEDFGVQFASIASPDGSMDTRPFGNATHRLPERNGQWTANAARCPGIVSWLQGTGLNYGSVRVLRKSNEIRDLRSPALARELFHRDTTNVVVNSESCGWIVRLLIQLTDNPSSLFLARIDRDNDAEEVAIPLSLGRQIIFDADQLWHTVWHPKDETRYALLVSLEGSPTLDRWIEMQIT